MDNRDNKELRDDTESRDTAELTDAVETGRDTKAGDAVGPGSDTEAGAAAGNGKDTEAGDAAESDRDTEAGAASEPGSDTEADDDTEKRTGDRKRVFILECAIFLAVALMLALSIQQSRILSGQVESLQSDNSSLAGKIEDAKARETAADMEDAKRSLSGQESESRTAEADKADPTPTLISTQTEILFPTDTPSPTPSPTPEPEPSFLMDLSDCAPGTIIDDSLIDPDDLWKYFTSSEIYEGDEIFNRIIGRSFQYNEYIQLSDLRYIKLLHRNYYGEIQVGEIIVNAAIEADVIDIFMQLYINDYQIYSMFLIDDFWAGDGDSSDFSSIEADNTSAFCYRTVTGSSTNLSKHAYGRAIDLNPLENPYVQVDGDGYGSSGHAGSQAYIYNRNSAEMPHVIDYNDLAYQVFTEHGFTWGGDWSNPKDYQHFQKEY